MVAVLADISSASPPFRRPQLTVVRPQPVRPRVSPAVYRARRIVAVGLLAAVLLAAWLGARAVLGYTGAGSLAGTGVPGLPRPAATKVWVVQPGDTLWSIAAAVDPHGDERPLVDRLSAEVHGSPLYPGEQIALP